MLCNFALFCLRGDQNTACFFQCWSIMALFERVRQLIMPISMVVHWSVDFLDYRSRSEQYSN